MDFLERLIVQDWCRDHRFPLDSRGDDLLPDPEHEVLERHIYRQLSDREGWERELAARCVAALGEWDECLLWITLWGIWPSSENWPAYYQTRGAEGELRSLDVAPGHLFQPAERGKLENFVCLVIENAWDACVLPVRGRQGNGRWALLSHDELVDILGHP
jgi:hypothetical protein